MDRSSPAARSAVFVVGAALAAAVAAGVSTVAPDPVPFAVAVAIVVPFFDAALHPESVPAEAVRALRAGAVSAAAGALAGVAAGALVVAAGGGFWARGIAVAVAWIAAGYAGRWQTAADPRT